MSDRLERLSKLATLKEQGVLTQAEFEVEKAAILSESDPGVGAVDSPDDPRWEKVVYESKVMCESAHWKTTFTGFGGTPVKVPGRIIVSAAGLDFRPGLLGIERKNNEERWQLPWENVVSIERLPVTWKSFGPDKNRRVEVADVAGGKAVIAVKKDVEAFVALVQPYLTEQKAA